MGGSRARWRRERWRREKKVKHIMAKDKNMRSRAWMKIVRCIFFFVGVAALSCALAIVSHAQVQSKENASVPSQPAQKAFDTPQQAVEALIQAADPFNEPVLLAIFGPEGKDFVSSSDPVQDKNYAKAFADEAHEKNTLNVDPKNPSRVILVIGKEDWPFPVPIVKKAGKWYFNSKEGHDEILFRRIGTNELDAIQVCHGFVEAQKEYAQDIHDNPGVHQYAQKIFSTPGKQDGLYWKNADGTSGGPIGKPVREQSRRAIPQACGLATMVTILKYERAGPGGATGPARLCDQRNHDRWVRPGCCSG